MSRLLEVKGVTVSFGGVKALEEVCFQVEQGELLCLIGPNGAGKTTLLKAILGVVSPQQARIQLDGAEISGLPTHRRIRLGLALTHQIVRPFGSMTLLDNVAFAAGHRRIQSVCRAIGGLDRRAERERAREFLDLVNIGEQAGQQVIGQPLGVLKRLEVARAMALEPRLLLLDEPLAGLNHVEARRLADTLVRINGQGLTLVLIEHNLGEVMRIAQRLMVLDNGRTIAQGEPQEVMRRPQVRAAYVGREQPHAAA